MNFTQSTNSPGAEPGSRAAGFFGRLALAGLLFVALAAAPAAPAHGGTLVIRVRDHREAIGDFADLEISVDAVRLSPRRGLKFWQLGWIGLEPTVRKIDLTKLTRGRSAVIYRGEVKAGSYEAAEVKISGIRGALKKNLKAAEVKSRLSPIELNFAVPEQGETEIAFDLVVLDVSDHPPGGYELHLKGYEIYNNGKLLDRIPPG